MAAVWLAHDARLDTRRAVKILDPQLRKSQKIRDRFEAEARAMARLHHPNVVTVHDVGDDGEHAYIVMELVHGGSLAEKVRTRGPLPPRLACEALAAVLDALDAAHALGIVHRDVKPHNMLLTADGTPKLTDFGIAQIDSGKANLTRTGSVMGTIPYMAPEQKLDSKAVGPAADVYGVGATLYHLVSGAEPYDLYVDQVRKQVLSKIYTEIAEIVDRATRYAPEERYRTAGEMRGALLGAIPRLPYPPVGMTAWMGVLPDTAIVAGSVSDPTPLAPDARTPADGDATATSEPGARPSAPTTLLVEDALAADVPLPSEVPTIAVARPDAPTVALGPAEAAPATPAPPGPPGRVPAWIALGALAVGGIAAVLVGAVALGPLGRTTPDATPDPAPIAAAPTPATPVPPTPLPAAEPADPAPAPVAPAPGPPPKPAPAPRPTATAPGPTPPTPAPDPAPAAPAPAAPAPAAPAPDPRPAPAAPAPTAPVATGHLLVQSAPAGLEVSVAGEKVGVTPLRHPLPPGTYRVVITGPAGASKTLSATVSAGKDARAGCWDFATSPPAPCKN